MLVLSDKINSKPDFPCLRLLYLMMIKLCNRQKAKSLTQRQCGGIRLQSKGCFLKVLLSRLICTVHRLQFAHYRKVKVIGMDFFIFEKILFKSLKSVVRSRQQFSMKK